MVEGPNVTEGRCRGCGTKVFFVTDRKGVNQILDVRKHPIFIEGTPRFGKPCWIRVEGARLSHFVTCTERDACKRTPRPSPGS